jgi:hypothetical protein
MATPEHTGIRPTTAFAIALGVLSGAGMGVVAAAVLKPTGDRVYVSSSQRTFTESRRVSAEGTSTLVRALRITAHGGTARVEWTNGAVSPLTPRSTVRIGLYVDGKQLATTLGSGRTGTYETRPSGIVWVGRLSSGSHDVQVRVLRADGRFLIPRASPSRPVADTLAITEYVT